MADVGKSCRLCLSKDELRVSIFGEYSLAKRLPEKMESCLQLRVHPKDSYSEYLCYACVHKLDTFTEFKNRVKLTLRKAKDNNKKDKKLQIVRHRQTECSDYFRAKKIFKNDVSADRKMAERKMADKENVVSHRLTKNALDIFECEDSDKIIKKDVSPSRDDGEDSFSLTPDIDFIFKLHQ